MKLLTIKLIFSTIINKSVKLVNYLKNINIDLGRNGEDQALKFLETNNFKILSRNFRCKIGEIDIIAKKNEDIIFVEVKTRTSSKFGSPGEAVTYKKRLKILKVAEFFILINKIKDCNFRFDVIEVKKENEKFIINHLENAISFDGF